MDEATPMPGPVRTARILLWAVIALTAIAVGFLALLAIPAAAPAQFRWIIGLNVLVLGVTVFLTIKLGARRRWARLGLIAVMALNLLGYLVNLTSATFSPGSLLGLGLAIAVIVCLVRPDSRAYLDQ